MSSGPFERTYGEKLVALVAPAAAMPVVFADTASAVGAVRDFFPARPSARRSLSPRNAVRTFTS